MNTYDTGNEKTAKNIESKIDITVSNVEITEEQRKNLETLKKEYSFLKTKEEQLEFYKNIPDKDKEYFKIPYLDLLTNSAISDPYSHTPINNIVEKNGKFFHNGRKIIVNSIVMGSMVEFKYVEEDDYIDELLIALSGTKGIMNNLGEIVGLGSNEAHNVAAYEELKEYYRQAEEASKGDILDLSKSKQNFYENMNPSKIRFSQTSVNGSAEIIESMKTNGWKGDPIDVVRMPDGGLTTLDNTRVAAAREVGIGVQANVRNFDDLLPDNLVKRFTTKKGVPKTWGEATELRIKKQKNSFWKNNPMGSNDLEKIK